MCLLVVVEYSCLGDWFVGKNHFFAVANTKESRKDEKYRYCLGLIFLKTLIMIKHQCNMLVSHIRCFLKNREDDYYLGASITPECNVLKTVEKVRKSHYSSIRHVLV